jgi:ferredoxin-NADP reductase
MDNDVTVEVIARRSLISDKILELKLSPADKSPIIPWEPGAHIELALPSGLVRQYSLCGEPSDDFYTIAVLKEEISRGGSIEIHDEIHEGDHLTVRGPKNHFKLEPGALTVFMAGGIGITPLLPMMRSLSKQGKPWVLHYGGKSLAALAYLDALQLMEGNEISIYLKNETRRIPVSEIISTLSTEDAIYVCGPESMISEVEEVGARLGVRVCLERFGPAPGEKPEIGGDSFEVELARSAKVLTVPADTRLIDIVRTVVPSVPFSCEEGYCGSCETGVLEGVPDHRDSILSPEEKSNNDCMMICVGRSLTPRLVLDL